MLLNITSHVLSKRAVHMIKLLRTKYVNWPIWVVTSIQDYLSSFEHERRYREALNNVR